MTCPRPGRRTVTRLWDGRAWPCAGHHAGLPCFHYGWAPAGLATIRQLTRDGLRPGGQAVAGWLVWGPPNRARWAYLYRIDLAKPKRAFTPALRAGLDRANTARRICPTCSRDAGYRIPRSLGQCWPCSEPHAATETEAA
jgi:hypothetical protein